MLFLKRDPLYPFETAILRAVLVAMRPPMRHMLHAQIDQVRYVQRSVATPEVNFYANRKGGGWASRWLFPNRAEVRLADVTARIRGAKHTGALYTVNGHIFSLTLRPPVRRARRAVLEDIDVRLADIGRLIDAEAGGTALDVAPKSFLEYVGGTAHAVEDGWGLFEPMDVFTVSLEDADWAVLAQGPDGRLLLGHRSGAEESFCLADPANDHVEPLTAFSMGSAMREAAKGAA